MNPEDAEFDDSEADERADEIEDTEASASDEPQPTKKEEVEIEAEREAIRVTGGTVLKPSEELYPSNIDIDALREKIKRTEEMAPGKGGAELFGIPEADYKKFREALKSVFIELPEDPRTHLKAVNLYPFGQAIIRDGKIVDIKKYLELACQQSLKKLGEPPAASQADIDKLKIECSDLLTKNELLLEYLLYQQLSVEPPVEEYDLTMWSAPGQYWEMLKNKLGVYSGDPRKRQEAKAEYARRLLDLNLDLLKPMKVKHKGTHCSSELINFYELIINPKYKEKFKNSLIPVGLLQMLIHRYEPIETEAKSKLRALVNEILRRGKTAIRPPHAFAEQRSRGWEPTYPRNEIERRLYEKSGQALIEPTEAYAPYYREATPIESTVVAMTDNEGNPLPDFVNLVKMIPKLGDEQIRLTRCMRERTNPPYWYVDYAVFLATQSQIASGGKPVINAMDSAAINRARKERLRHRSELESRKYREWQAKARKVINDFSEATIAEAIKKTASNVAAQNVMSTMDAIKFLDDYVHHKEKRMPQNPIEQKVADSFWTLFNELYHSDTIKHALLESGVIPEREVKTLVTTKVDEHKTLACENKWISSIDELNDARYPKDIAKLVIHHLCKGTSEIPRATASKMEVDQSKSTRTYDLLREAGVLQYSPDQKVDEVKQAIEVAEVQKPEGWQTLSAFEGKTLWGQPEKVTDEFIQWTPQGPIDTVTGLHMDKIVIEKQADPNDPTKTIEVTYKLYDVLWQPYRPPQTGEGKQWVPAKGELKTITGRTHIETRPIRVMPRESKLITGYGATRGGISSLSRIAQRMPQSRMRWDGKMWVADGVPLQVPSRILSGTQIEHIPTPKTLEAACGIPSVDPLNPYSSLEQCREKILQLPSEALAPMVQRLRTLIQGVRDKLRAEEEARQAKLGKVPGIAIVPARLKSWKRAIAPEIKEK